MAARDPQALAEACARAMWAEDRASQSLGMRLDAVGPGRARLSMEVAAHMANGHGICHGGFIFALADSAFAFACNTHGERVVAQHCAVTYFRSARPGEVLVAEAQERVRAGRSGLYDITVRTAAGEAIAEFRGHSRTLGTRFFGGEEDGGSA